MDLTTVAAALVLFAWFVAASAIVIAIAVVLRRRGLVIRLWPLRLVRWNQDGDSGGLNRRARRLRSRKRS
jgi:hypothetical protein